MGKPRAAFTIAAFGIALCAIAAALVLITKPTTPNISPQTSTTQQPATLFAPIPMTTKSGAQSAESTTQQSTAAQPPKTTAAQPPKTTAAQPPKTVTQPKKLEELRGVWISFYELMQPEGGATEAAFTKKYAAWFDQCKTMGITELFVHVRPFADAIYPSELFPWSEILTGEQGRDPGFDPLGILCGLARERGLRVHAWLNPFRAARTADITRLAAGNPALRHLNANDDWVRRANNQYYWNPAVPETLTLIYDGVRELLRKYDVAGVHIDDYFYPTTDASFDAAQFEAYQAGGGALDLADWRRGLVNQFVRGLYRTVKEEKPKAVVSISPAAGIAKNYETLYADTQLWMREAGYCDWMIPQIYFGFDHKTMPFEALAKQWAQAARHENLKLLFGLAAYKVGAADDYAGIGAQEWTQHSDILARQVEFARTRSGYSGFVLYSYRGIFGNGISEIAKLERQNLQKLLNLG